MADRTEWFLHEVLVHEPALRGYLRRLASHGLDVDDLLQETYARVLTLSDEAPSRIQAVRPFLFRTARNVTIDKLRHRQVISLQTLTELDESSVVDEGPTADELLGTHQELQLLAEVVAGLPDRCRQVLTLRKIYGLPVRQIAEQLGIAEHTVEKHIGHGLRLCAERLYDLQEGGGGARMKWRMGRVFRNRKQ